MRMRISTPLIVLGLLLGSTVFAQDETKTQETKAAKSETTNDVSQRAAAASRKPKGPDVVLIQSEKRTIYEFRENGRLTMIKIVPRKGRAYYLVPEDPTLHNGELGRATRLVARWVIKEF